MGPFDSHRATPVSIVVNINQHCAPKHFRPYHLLHRDYDRGGNFPQDLFRLGGKLAQYLVGLLPNGKYRPSTPKSRLLPFQNSTQVRKARRSPTSSRACPGGRLMGVCGESLEARLCPHHDLTLWNFLHSVKTDAIIHSLTPYFISQCYRWIEHDLLIPTLR